MCDCKTRPRSGSSKGESCERTMATAAATADYNCQSRQIGAGGGGTSFPMAANVLRGAPLATRPLERFVGPTCGNDYQIRQSLLAFAGLPA